MQRDRERPVLSLAVTFATRRHFELGPPADIQDKQVRFTEKVSLKEMVERGLVGEARSIKPLVMRDNGCGLALRGSHLVFAPPRSDTDRDPAAKCDRGKCNTDGNQAVSGRKTNIYNFLVES